MIASWGIGAFALAAYDERWVPWSELENAAWPGARLRADDPRRTLRDTLERPGVYIVTWTSSTRRPRGSPHAAHDAIVYIGETGSLRRRMGQFGNSAGFFGQRGPGHSGGWRWDESWSKDGAFFAVYPAPEDVIDAGLAPLWRLCREAQALAAYAEAHRQRLPVMNAKGANNSKTE
jgi:hypothetical protein